MNQKIVLAKINSLVLLKKSLIENLMFDELALVHALINEELKNL